jgi:hypothetical protein
VAGTTTKSQYLSSFQSVASSGTVFFGNGEVNGHHFRNSVVQVLDGQTDSARVEVIRVRSLPGRPAAQGACLRKSLTATVSGPAEQL